MQSLCIIIFCCVMFGGQLSAAKSDSTTLQPWQTLTDGLELARFALGSGKDNDSAIVILRIDPEHFDMRAYCLSQTDEGDARSAREWCSQHELIAGINAGMFLKDRSTHVGYLKTGSHINNETIVSSDYRSAAAFGPSTDSLPRFRIYDLDETEIDSIIAAYDLVVQNIRLIKRPRENRWSDQDEKWSEAALAEDRQGNILFVFSRIPMSMYEFNEHLLDLPVDIFAAQHLEGGHEAQLYIRWEGAELELVGQGESGFVKNNTLAWPIPNILGISPRR
ncbi:hypothetical protein GF356_04505 [candidate division GN15 bacterium]|nr:hypothetical protein [candidate division GN15 bacterium]